MVGVDVVFAPLVIEVSGALSGVLGIVGYIPDIRSIRRRNVKPPRIAWLIWSMQYVLLVALQVTKGGIGFWLCLPALQLIGTLMITWLSFNYGDGAFSPVRDILTCLVVVAALILWMLTKNAILSMALLMAIEGIGMVFIIQHAHARPREETMWIWRGCTLGGFFGIIAAIPTHSYLIITYPAFFTLMGASVIIARWAGMRAWAPLFGYEPTIIYPDPELQL